MVIQNREDHTQGLPPWAYSDKQQLLTYLHFVIYFLKTVNLSSLSFVILFYICQKFFNVFQCKFFCFVFKLFNKPFFR